MRSLGCEPLRMCKSSYLAAELPAEAKRFMEILASNVKEHQSPFYPLCASPCNLLSLAPGLQSGASYRMLSEVMRELKEDTHLATDTAAILLGGMGSRSGSSNSNRDHSDQSSTSFGQTLQSAFQTLHR